MRPEKDWEKLEGRAVVKKELIHDKGDEDMDETEWKDHKVNSYSIPKAL